MFAVIAYQPGLDVLRDMRGTTLTKGHLTRRQAGKIIDHKKTFRPILCSTEELAAIED